MPAKRPYRLIESQTIYKGHVIRLVKDRFILKAAPGKIVKRELVIHPGAVVILPFTDARRILLIKQFRYSAKGDLWEIPAGTLEKGEAALACAKRELEEETGFRAGRWKKLTQFFPAPGVSNEMMTLFAAWDLSPGRKNLDHDEWITHRRLSIAEAVRRIRNGSIRDGKTIAGILWALAYLKVRV